MIQVTESGAAVHFGVKIVPGASRTRFLGEWQGRARIAVAAPPEKGKANKAVRDFLAELLEIDSRRISVVTGQSSPLKTIRIEGVTASVLQAAFQPRRS